MLGLQTLVVPRRQTKLTSRLHLRQGGTPPRPLQAPHAYLS